MIFTVTRQVNRFGVVYTVLVPVTELDADERISARDVSILLGLYKDDDKHVPFDWFASRQTELASNPLVIERRIAETVFPELSKVIFRRSNRLSNTLPHRLNLSAVPEDCLTNDRRDVWQRLHEIPSQWYDQKANKPRCPE